jgi:hypothetical protein
MKQVHGLWFPDYDDHLKGKRKDYGKSLVADLKVKRQEGYWQ